MKNVLYFTALLLFALTKTYAQDCNMNEEAQRHFARATGAVKDAQNNEDYLDAIEEFKKVLDSSPNCPDIYYNIGICYDKSSNSGHLKDIAGCEQAIVYFKKYLALKPNAQDKQAVQNRIDELGYRYDKLNKLLPMVYVEGGTFKMGSIQGKDYEKNAHQVKLSSYYIGKYVVMQTLWEEVMGTTLRQQGDKLSDMGAWGNRKVKIVGEGDNYPMYYVSWDDVQEFIRRLNAMTGKQYRLPTEAEWEYAARGGNKSKGYKFSGSNELDDVACDGFDSGGIGGTINPVGTKQPNELGIYDMSGNVWEWCNDWYDKYYSGTQQDPQGPLSGSSRVLRGGSYSVGGGKELPITFRYHRGSDNAGFYHTFMYFGIGFRLACSSGINTPISVSQSITDKRIESTDNQQSGSSKEKKTFNSMRTASKLKRNKNEKQY